MKIESGVKVLSATVPALVLISMISLCINPVFAQAATIEVEEEFVLLAPTSEKYITPFLDEFKAWAGANYGVTIATSHVKLGSEVAVTKVQMWDGNPMADVFFSARTPYFMALKADGLLEPYKGGKAVDWWGDIPEEAFDVATKDPDGYWAAFAISGFGIMVNREKLAMENLSAPTSWIDLAKPEYKDHIVAGNPATTGIAHMILEGILQGYGWDEGWKLYLKITRNTAVFTRSTGAGVTLCAKGEYAITMTKDSDWYGKRAKYPVDWIWPADGMGVVPIATAQLKGAPHPEAGKLFVDFVMSDVGLKKWAELRMERPIRPEVEIPAGMPTLAEIQAEWTTIPYDTDLYMARNVSVSALVATKILGYHEDIKKATDEKLDGYYQTWIVDPRNSAMDAIEVAENAIEEIIDMDLTEEGEVHLVRAEAMLEAAQTAFDTYNYTAAYDSARMAKQYADAATGEEAPPAIPTETILVIVIVVVVVLAFLVGRRI